MKRFKPKPAGEPRAPRTEAQQTATWRAFHIFRLRGLYHQAFLLTEPRRGKVQAIIDDELVSLGAESEADRHAMKMAAFSAEETDRRTREEIDEQELPF